jgi:2-keto-4-pentenoate hydratase
MLEDADPGTIAQALVDARAQARLIPPIPGAFLPSREAALELQGRAVALWGRPRVGWKIGATNAQVQARLGTDRPFAGPLFAPDCHPSGATLALPPGVRGVEIELAFRLGQDLPRRAEPYAEDEMRAAVASLHPAIEMVGTRQDMPALDARRAIADFALNMAFVHGPAIPDWERLDLAAVTASCIVNGEAKASGAGSAVLGSPLTALRWLADEGLEPRAGEWVSTGTFTGITPVGPGDHVIGEFGPLGRVELHVAA